jgi:NAD-dependent deacetylase
MHTDLQDRLVDQLRTANHVLIFTGAGISTGSGIPDFRGPNGVWKTRQPVYYQDFMSSERFRIEHWDYKLEAAEAFRDARPNAVHEAVVELETAGKLAMVVTQNIDGLHQRAGTTDRCLVELHGTNAAVECQGCLERSDPEPHFVAFRDSGKAPLCASCGGFLKIATISFGQNLRSEDIEAAERSAAEADLVIALGSTLSVYPAASIPLSAAERGIPYTIINRGPTDHDAHAAVTVRIDGDVGKVFPSAVEQALG